MNQRSIRAVVAIVGALVVGGCGTDTVVVEQPSQSGPRAALVVVSPHPDDESIFGAATIHRIAADPTWDVHAVYVSGGDGATVPGDCNGIPEAQKIQMIIALRESETRAAWKVIAPDRDVPITFERGPDQKLVASSTVVDGVRQDVLTPAGELAMQGAADAAAQVPSSVERVLFLTTSIYDGHPDHRTAYHATRLAAERLRAERGIDVRIWSWIVHDEVPTLTLPTCCAGDFHWPAPGPTHDYEDLTDTPQRPRPPHWNHVENVADLQDLRIAALAQHVSQIQGYPPLCMPDYVPDFYTRWNQKQEEPFYEEVL